MNDLNFNVLTCNADTRMTLKIIHGSAQNLSLYSTISSEIQMSKNAPIGELKPSKNSFGFVSELTLNLASLIATDRVGRNEKTFPNSELLKNEFIRIAEVASPKVTRSARESNSSPNFDDIPKERAILPSAISKINPSTTK